MIIFGWGRRITWNIGPTSNTKCSHCNNENYFHIKVVTTWFTLFFIPIFPYERYHFLYCPVCEYGVKLKPDQVDLLKPLASLNQRFIDGKITQQEYNHLFQDLSGGVNTSASGSTSKVSNKKYSNNSYFDSLHKKQ